MNIIEAIKSGRPIRLNTWDNWYAPNGVGTYLDARGQGLSFRAAFILSEEWEIQEPFVTITRSQLGEAFNHALRSQVPTWSYGHADALLRELTVRLRLLEAAP